MYTHQKVSDDDGGGAHIIDFGKGLCELWPGPFVTVVYLGPCWFTSLKMNQNAMTHGVLKAVTLCRTMTLAMCAFYVVLSEKATANHIAPARLN